MKPFYQKQKRYHLYEVVKAMDDKSILEMRKNAQKTIRNIIESKTMDEDDKQFLLRRL